MALLSGEVETGSSMINQLIETLLWFRMALLSGEVETGERLEAGRVLVPRVPDGFAIRGS